MIIPFANPLGPQSGSLADGVLFGILPQVAPTTTLALSHLAAPAAVFRGNADATGGLAYTDLTAAAISESPHDVSLFDTLNPTADRHGVTLSPGDSINGISLLVSTAAVLTGTPVADIYYRTASGWRSATNITTPILTSTGLKRVGCDVISYDDIAPIDNLIDPRHAAQIRCVFLQFSGITAVSTAPLFSQIYLSKPHSATLRSADITNVLGQGNSPVFTTQQTKTIPITDDRLLFGFDEKPVRLFPTRYRRDDSGVATEWVYSKADGTFPPFPPADINDPTTRLTAVLTAATPAHQRTNLTTTLTTGTWGGGGIASTETLAGDGYVEFRVGANPALALMVGFSESNANAHYNSIGWAIHTGHGATAFGSQWRNGAQQSGGTWAVVAGDVLRLDRHDAPSVLDRAPADGGR